jgi:hypothetical protein
LVIEDNECLAVRHDIDRVVVQRKEFLPRRLHGVVAEGRQLHLEGAVRIGGDYDWKAVGAVAVRDIGAFPSVCQTAESLRAEVRIRIAAVGGEDQPATTALSSRCIQAESFRS